MLDAYGWRIAFLLGAVTVPFGLMLRKTMPETLHAPDHHPPPVAAKRAGGFPIPRVVILGTMILASGTISTYVINYMTTFAQDTLHLGTKLSFAASLVPNLVNLPAVLLGGWLSDRHGRRPVMLWPQIGRVVLVIPIFYLIVAHPSPASLLGGMAVIGILQGLVSGGFYAALSESLEKTSRSQMFALTYSIAIMIFGGTTQMVVTWLIHVTGESMSPGYYLTGACIVGLIAIILMKESAPARLVAAPTLKPATV